MNTIELYTENGTFRYRVSDVGDLMPYVNSDLIVMPMELIDHIELRVSLVVVHPRRPFWMIAYRPDREPTVRPELYSPIHGLYLEIKDSIMSYIAAKKRLKQLEEAHGIPVTFNEDLHSALSS